MAKGLIGSLLSNSFPELSPGIPYQISPTTYFKHFQIVCRVTRYEHLPCHIQPKQLCHKEYRLPFPSLNG